MTVALSGFRTVFLRSVLNVSVVSVLAVSAMSVVTTANAQQGKTLGGVKTVNVAAVQDGVKSQKSINRYDDKTSVLVGEYRAALVQLDALREYNGQLEKLIKAQKSEMINIRQQIEDVTSIDRTIVPHMFRMIEGLDAFVQLDTPFLIDERTARVQRLRDLMDRSDANPAEKYRKILEAFEIENEYGRTIEAYEGQLVVDDAERTVNFLRLGRVTWLYQTLDRSDSAIWDNSTRTWVDLDGDFDSEINTAFRVAKEQAAPNLLTVPVFGAYTKGGN